MAKIDQLYNFRLATVDDIDTIMDFYKREWNVNHILANDRDFFCYQHQNGDSVNFMLAINSETGQLEGAEGFIQYSEQLLDVGAVMWKVSRASKTPYLGVEIVKHLKAATECRVYLGPGANPVTAVPLHQKVLKHQVGKLKHFYMLADIEEYRIASIERKPESGRRPFITRRMLRRLSGIEELRGRFDYRSWIARKPYKDAWYIDKRYFKNPIYKYLVYAVTAIDENVSSILVAREVNINDAKILRIVDVIGDTDCLAELETDLRRLLAENTYEYIDIYCKGIPDELFKQGGFTHRDENDPNIIPNYFEPFVQKNVDIWYALSDDDTILFKGDGDQDRPSFRPPTSDTSIQPIQGEISGRLQPGL